MSKVKSVSRFVIFRTNPKAELVFISFLGGGYIEATSWISEVIVSYTIRFNASSIRFSDICLICSNMSFEILALEVIAWSYWSNSLWWGVVFCYYGLIFGFKCKWFVILSSSSSTSIVDNINFIKLLFLPLSSSFKSSLSESSWLVSQVIQYQWIFIKFSPESISKILLSVFLSIRYFLSNLFSSYPSNSFEIDDISYCIENTSWV